MWAQDWADPIASQFNAAGGFVGAAEVALEGCQGNAELEAIARTAQHRLERGIWTSPGAGDLR